MGASSLVGVPLCGYFLSIDFACRSGAVAAGALMLPGLVAAMRHHDEGEAHDGGAAGQADEAVGEHELALPTGATTTATPTAMQTATDTNSADATRVVMNRHWADPFHRYRCSPGLRLFFVVKIPSPTLLMLSSEPLQWGSKTSVLVLACQYHGYNESAVAGAATVLGIDIREVLLTLLLLKKGCISAGNMSAPTWFCTAASMAFFWHKQRPNQVAHCWAHSCLLFVHVYGMKAVQCLSVATTDEKGEGGFPEIAYTELAAALL